MGKRISVLPLADSAPDTAYIPAVIDGVTERVHLSQLPVSVAQQDALDEKASLAALNEKAALNLTINTEAGTARTLSSGDVNNYTRMTNASASTYTFAPNSSVAVSVGATVHIRQAGAGQVTLVAGSGVTLNTNETLKLRKQGSTVSATKVATDEWDVYGDLEAAP